MDAANNLLVIQPLTLTPILPFLSRGPHRVRQNSSQTFSFSSANKVFYILRIFKCLNFSLSSYQIAYLTSGIRPGKAKTFMIEALIMSQLSEMRILRQPVDHQVCCVLHADSTDL